MNKLKDMTGHRFGRLLVLERADNTAKGKARWKCRCDCGNIIIAEGANLRSGASKSCGCIGKEKTIQRSTKHGDAKRGKCERLYRVWRGIVGRCYQVNNNSYQYYGARGITVCDEWRNNYAAFKAWALANGYNDSAKRGECTLDRIDVNGNYCPENCRWVSMAVQNENRRVT